MAEMSQAPRAYSRTRYARLCGGAGEGLRPASQEAFGSAVTFDPETGDGEPAELALAKYRYFVGDH